MRSDPRKHSPVLICVHQVCRHVPRFRPNPSALSVPPYPLPQERQERREAVREFKGAAPWEGVHARTAAAAPAAAAAAGAAGAGAAAGADGAASFLRFFFARSLRPYPRE